MDGVGSTNVAVCSGTTPADLSQPRVFIIDQDNVRATMGWPASRDFRERVYRWMAAQKRPPLTLIEVDERQRSDRSGPHAARHGNRLIVVYSGPRWRADDGIVRDVEWWIPKLAADFMVTVVSSDKLVRRRCREVQQRVAPKARLRFECAESYGFMLPSPDGLPQLEAAPPKELPTEVASCSSAPREGASPPSELLFESGLPETYVTWINETHPRPSQTASMFVHGGTLQRHGHAHGSKKRRRVGTRIDR